MSEPAPKVLKRAAVRLFNYHIPGVIELILSFLEECRSCLCFALTCKRVHYVWNYMMDFSSVMRYRCRFLNDLPRRSILLRNAFDRLDPCRFVSSLDEYTAHISPRLNRVIAAMAELNRDGPVAFISGGAAVEWLLRRGDYTALAAENAQSRTAISTGRNYTDWAAYSPCDSRFNPGHPALFFRSYDWAKKPDVDIFMRQGADLGAAEALGARNGLKKYRVPWRKQLCVADKDTPAHTLLDLITIDPEYSNPVCDVLCTFDLVCCSVAFVPHPTCPAVLWLPETARAISSRVVRSGPVAWPYNTFNRFCKYRYRLGLHPSLDHPHDLRRYHKSCVNPVHELYAPRPMINYNASFPGAGEYGEGRAETVSIPLKQDARRFGFAKNGGGVYVYARGDE